MTTDISHIRQSLKRCEEVTLPYLFPKKCWIKYITLKDDDEHFYEGGEFIGMGNHKLFINVKGRSTCVPTIIRSDEGEILYRARFFIDPTVKPACEQEKHELLKTIKAQQQIIKRVAEQIKVLEATAHEYQSSNYELRTELEEKDHLLKEQLIKEKKYKLILSQYR
jgi:hypothetical protein